MKAQRRAVPLGAGTAALVGLLLAVTSCGANPATKPADQPLGAVTTSPSAQPTVSGASPETPVAVPSSTLGQFNRVGIAGTGPMVLPETGSTPGTASDAAPSAANEASAPTGVSAPAKQLPVSYNFLQNTITVNTAASAPGENDWNCRPTTAHPRPVVLVHGTGGNAATNWVTYAALLSNNGYCVFALTYGVASIEASSPIKLGGMNDIASSAQELKSFVARVLSTTHATQVDIVGHSQGTYMPNYWVRFLGGAPYVHNYVSLAPLWQGTGMGGSSQEAAFMKMFGTSMDSAIPICTACGQMVTGSNFATTMSSGRVAAPGINYLNISTKYDELVMPYTSGQLTGYPNMKNVVLQDYCSNDFTEHFEIASDPNAAQFVLAFLNNGTVPSKISCKTVLPFNGFVF